MCCTADLETKKLEFEKLALQCLDPLYDTAFRMTKSEEKAQALIQDTYIRAYKAFDEIEGDLGFRIWLFKIFKSMYMIKYSQEDTKEKIKAFCSCDFDDIENIVINTSDDIATAVEFLPEYLRFAVILSNIEGFSYKQIAEILGISEDCVAYLLNRGLKILKKSLQFNQKNKDSKKHGV